MNNQNSLMSLRNVLQKLFLTAVKQADPAHVLKNFLPDEPVGRTIVIGAGKAAASMANAVEKLWLGSLDGIVVTRYGHNRHCNFIEVIEASHPIPDKFGELAAYRILDKLQDLTKNDLVLCLISGGGSSLLSLPGRENKEAVVSAEITLSDKQALNKALLQSGANIAEINTVRKHLSAIKGGRLAVAAYPARIVTLGISDIPGDEPSLIASGPTLPDLSTSEDALSVLEKYHIDIPDHIKAFLNSPSSETPKPGDPVFANTEFRMIATPQASLNAAATKAEEFGFNVHNLGDRIEGEAREVAADQARLATKISKSLKPGDKPVILISGGETTVTVSGNGRGGRNTEFLLALAISLESRSGIHALACDTDGIDGSEDNAGAYIAPDTLSRAKAMGLDAELFLANNDGYTFFQTLKDLVITGPTLTNVNDFRSIIIEAPPY